MLGKVSGVLRRAPRRASRNYRLSLHAFSYDSSLYGFAARFLSTFVNAMAAIKRKSLAVIHDGREKKSDIVAAYGISRNTLSYNIEKQRQH